MITIPEAVRTAWTNREGPAVFTTVDASGVPNSVYVGSLQVHDDNTVVIADNYFHKTRANLLAGSHGALLFLTKERKSFQLKGSIEYLTAGPIFDEMKQWNPTKHPGVAAAVLHLEEIYSGAERLA